jgi:peptidoglycan/LPS O-acetylase OafA/YrhL
MAVTQEASRGTKETAARAPRRQFAASLREYSSLLHTRAVRIAELDGLRAAAIALVLARHGVRPFTGRDEALFPLFGWDAGSLLTNGWIGVDLFFVLSGFLIAHHLLASFSRASGSAWSYRRYLWKRALRIVPLYYFVLSATVLGAFPLYQISQSDLFHRTLYHVVFLQDYLPSDIVVAFWSLGVEEKFYLLAPVILAFALRSSRRGMQYSALAALTLLSPASRILTAAWQPDASTYEGFFVLYRSPFHASLETLLVGVLCAFVYRDRAHLIWTQNAGVVRGMFWLGAAALLWLTCSAPMLEQINAFDKVLQPSIIAWCTGALVLSVLLGAPEGRWLGNKALQPVATLAYSLYLVHLPLLPLAAALAERWQPAASGGQFLLFLPCYLFLSFGVAALLHLLVEKPFLVLKDRL